MSRGGGPARSFGQPPSSQGGHNYPSQQLGPQPRQPVAHVAGVNAYLTCEEPGWTRTRESGDLDPQIEEVNEVDWVVKRENAGLLASALEEVTFRDSYQREEVKVNAAEKRAWNVTSGEDLTRKKLHSWPVIRSLKQGTTGQALLEADITEIPVSCINACSEPKLLDEICQDLEVSEEDDCYNSDDESSSDSQEVDSGNGLRR